MFINRRFKTPRANSGQSTVEYIVLATAVIAAVIFFVAPKANNQQSDFQAVINNTMGTAMNTIDDRTSVLADSHTGNVSDPKYSTAQMQLDAAQMNSLIE